MDVLEGVELTNQIGGLKLKKEKRRQDWLKGKPYQGPKTADRRPLNKQQGSNSDKGKQDNFYIKGPRNTGESNKRQK